MTTSSGRSNSVFFDEANKEVFAVSGGNSEVFVKSLDRRRNATIKIPNKGPVASIKFSLDHKILAIQRSPQMVDFVNLEKKGDVSDYSQQCKGKVTQVIGFQWTGINEIVFITNQGIQLYQVIPEKQTLKCLKTYSVSVKWFVFSCELNVLLLFSGHSNTIIHPYMFRASSIVRIPKFDVELPQAATGQTKARLLERDVTIASLYKQTFVVVVKSWSKMSGGAEIVLYLLTKEAVARKTAVLKMDITGRLAINAVDNLLLVHHQASKTSVMFDICWDGQQSGAVTIHHPVVSPLPIASCFLTNTGQSESAEAGVMCELYSANWVVFQPNIIIDARLGCLWEVSVELEPLVTMMPDKARLVDFLLLRQDAKSVILNVCKQALVPGRRCNLQTIARIFDKLNGVYSDSIQSHIPLAERRSTMSSLKRLDTRRTPPGVIDEADMYTYVLSIFESSSVKVDYKFIVAVLIEYIRSLSQHGIPVLYVVYEQLIKTLVGNKCFYQLHQFLQYHVLNDSKQLACLLLSIQGEYSPAYQLALDMLKRLQTADAEIFEVLISKAQLLQALRFARSIGKEDSISARQFLEAAAGTQDNMLFYTVFKFFEDRNMRLRRRPEFATGEHCQQYVKLFYSLYSEVRNSQRLL